MSQAPSNKRSRGKDVTIPDNVARCRLECDNISKKVRRLSYNQEYYDNFTKF